VNSVFRDRNYIKSGMYFIATAHVNDNEIIFFRVLGTESGPCLSETSTEIPTAQMSHISRAQ
jgi:hypothetical protein